MNTQILSADTINYSIIKSADQLINAPMQLELQQPGHEGMCSIPWWKGQSSKSRQGALVPLPQGKSLNVLWVSSDLCQLSKVEKGRDWGNGRR